MSKMIIANRLVDGLVVFRAGDGGWTESIDAGLTFADEAGAAAALDAALGDHAVIDPCLIDVAADGGRLEPVAVRESIRAHGPTIDVDADAPQETV